MATYLANRSTASVELHGMVREALKQETVSYPFALERDLSKSQILNLEADAFALCYCIVIPEIVPTDRYGKYLAQVVHTDSFMKLRERSSLDPVYSMFGAIAILETIAMQHFMDQDIDVQEIDSQLAPKVEKAFDVVELADQIALSQEEKDQLDDGHGGVFGGGPDFDEVEIESTLQTRLMLALEASNNEQFKIVLEAAGRMEMIKSEILDDEVSGGCDSQEVELGDDLSKADLGYLSTRPDEMIASDMADQSLEIMEGIEKGGEGNGPVIVVLDISSSMNAPLGEGRNQRRIDWAIATAFSILKDARDNDRQFCFIPFAGSFRRHLSFKTVAGQKIEASHLRRLLTTRASGGTSFREATEAVTEALNEYEDADVIWLTDGEISAEDGNETNFMLNKRMKREHDERGIRHFGFNFGGQACGYIIRLFCNAGPSERRNHPLHDRSPELPEPTGTNRMFEGIVDMKGLEEGCKTLWSEMNSRNEGTDWL